MTLRNSVVDWIRIDLNQIKRYDPDLHQVKSCIRVNLEKSQNIRKIILREFSTIEPLLGSKIRIRIRVMQIRNNAQKVVQLLAVAVSQILIRKNYPDASLHDHTICSWFKITDPQISIRNQGFGYGLDPCSIGPVDPDPYSESGSGSRRAKMTHKSRKKLVKVYVLSVGWPLL